MTLNENKVDEKAKKILRLRNIMLFWGKRKEQNLSFALSADRTGLELTR
jgi:hypothetical protein